MNWAWLAGLIDGDGCFTIGRRTQANGLTYENPILMIDMTHEPTIRYIQTELGRSVYETKNQPRRRQAYRWQTMGDGLRLVLQESGPFFVTKKKQAEIVTEIMALKKMGPYLREPERQEELFQMLRDLNQGVRV